MNEIKNCPFCGKEAKEEDDEFYFGILCTNCGYGWNYEESSGTNSVVKEQWNTRPIEEDLQKSLDALGKKCSGLEHDRDYNAELCDSLEESLDKLDLINNLLAEENKRLSGIIKAMNEQLDIATDLGDKRWKELEKIKEQYSFDRYTVSKEKEI